MPGMMDTVLNLGLNDESVKTLAKTSGDARFAYDSYRRFIQMYSNVVLEVESHNFEEIIEEFKDRKRPDARHRPYRRRLARGHRGLQAQVEEETGKPFPQSAKDQLWGAVGAVFGSWMNARAITYRRLNNIPADWGTAVNVQAMVFGNMGETSATGVAFTRNPSTGAKELYGEFLVNAQGEDVVAGIRTPQNITEVARKAAGSDRPSLEAIMPEVFEQFVATTQLLEKHYSDMQDLEFTVERGKLWMLQTRNGKRTARAALRVAVDMANEGLISREEAITRVDPAALDQLLHPMIDPNAKRTPLATGLPASPGAASGEIVFSAEEAEQLRAGRPQDHPGARRDLARGHPRHARGRRHRHDARRHDLPRRGRRARHGQALRLRRRRPSHRLQRADDERRRRHAEEGRHPDHRRRNGQVIAGAVPMVKPKLTGEFATLMQWADGVRRMKVRANAETPLDARTARGFGAEGIGLCRTEHMFFEGERIVAVREMILADNEAGRRAALAKLLPMQRQDFAELFEIMNGLPVTIRLLDPPLHEFLPHTEAEIAEVANAMGVSAEKLRARANELHEVNPMLGFRGVRLAMRYPEIAEMQARAIFEGAVEAGRKTGAPVTAEIMVPLVMGAPNSTWSRRSSSRWRKRSPRRPA